MSYGKTILIPSMTLSYIDNRLESVGLGGELYKRNSPLVDENARLKAENEKLRELIQDMHISIGSFNTTFSDFLEFGNRAKKLGVEL